MITASSLTRPPLLASFRKRGIAAISVTLAENIVQPAYFLVIQFAVLGPKLLVATLMAINGSQDIFLPSKDRFLIGYYLLVIILEAGEYTSILLC